MFYIFDDDIMHAFADSSKLLSLPSLQRIPEIRIPGKGTINSGDVGLCAITIADSRPACSCSSR